MYCRSIEEQKGCSRPGTTFFAEMGGGTMDCSLLIETAVLAGEIMLKSGAEAYRVEDTMAHILSRSDAEHIDPVAYNTAILLTYQAKGKEPVSVIRRVKERGTNLNNIVMVNDISRRFCKEEITLCQANEELRAIRGKQYSSWIYNLGTVGIVLGFVLFFGGTGWDLLAAVLVGAVLATLMTMGKRLKFNAFFQDVWCSIGISFVTILLRHAVLTQMNIDTVIISAIMPLVPGVAITNAVRDTLQGDYLSGAARILEAFLKAAAIAIGIGIGMAAITGIIGRGMI